MSTEVFLLATSLGAVDQLESVVAALPTSVPVAVVVVAPGRQREDGLLERLSSVSSLPVREPEDKDEIVAGAVYLAPAGYHLMLDGGSFALSREPPVAGERPSLVPLFESAADAYANRAAGLVIVGTSGSQTESVGLLQARGGACAVVRMESDVTPRPEVGGVPVLSLDAATDWMIEMCTGHHLRGAYERGQ